MRLKENFIKEDSQAKMYDWGNRNEPKLKHKYKSINSEVKEYKMSKKELEEYLKKFR